MTSPDPATPAADLVPVAELGYEAARDELVRVVHALESGGASLEESLARVVSSRPESRAYRVDAVDGEVVELPLGVDYLGARPTVEAALAA